MAEQIQDLHKTYRFVSTADGSPTLELGYDSGWSEAMHNSQGALEESVYIYGHALNESFSKLSSPQVLSVGLGLGYNEILTSVYSLIHKLPSTSIRLTSYEQEEFLKDSFLKFINSDLEDAEFLTAYNWILNTCSKNFEISSSLIVE